MLHEPWESIYLTSRFGEIIYALCLPIKELNFYLQRYYYDVSNDRAISLSIRNRRLSWSCYKFECFIGWWTDIQTSLKERAGQGRHFNFFLGGPNFFFIFQYAIGLLKNWKKQHFICSNLTLFIVPFFFSLSFFLFSFSFFFFSFFFSFFSFSLGGGGGDAPQPPLNDASGAGVFTSISFSSLLIESHDSQLISWIDHGFR